MYVYTIYTVTVNEKRGHEFQGEKGGGDMGWFGGKKRKKKM